MPYKIYPSGDKYAVYKKGPDGKKEGKTLGTHDSYKKALAQLRALYASEKGEDSKDIDTIESGEKYYNPYSQREANYRTLSDVAGRACSNCRWFSKYGGCHIVENYPEDILPNGVSDFWAEKVVQRPDPVPVIVVDEDDYYKSISDDPGILKKGIRALIDMLTGKKSNVETLEAGFKVFEDNTWFGWWSNNFKDRVNEVFPYAAQDAYIERVQKGIVPYPTLRFWHIKGTDCGPATHIGRAGNFMWARGTFFDDEKSLKLRDYASKNGPWGMSHGFRYYKSLKLNGTYHYFDTEEVTFLPPHAACNPYTMFDDGGKEMKATQDQIEALAKAVGPDLAAKLIANSDKAGEALEKSGVESKALQEPPEMAAKKDLDETRDSFAQAMVQVAEGMKSLQSTVETRFTDMDTRMKAVETTIAGYNSLESRATKDARTLVTPEQNPALKMMQEKQEQSGYKSIVEQAMAGAIENVGAPAEK